MRHEEEQNHWHPSDRRRHTDRREDQRHREDQNFNDFGSRWGEPEPRLSPRHQDQRQQENHDRRGSRSPKEDWHPFERQIEEQHRRNQGYDNRRQEHHQQQQQQEPTWRQRDRHFNSDNQHANDRWEQSGSMPHPNQNERRHNEDEHRRRRFRDDRDDRY